MRPLNHITVYNYQGAQVEVDTTFCDDIHYHWYGHNNILAVEVLKY